jgi:hypothetical protein
VIDGEKWMERVDMDGEIDGESEWRMIDGERWMGRDELIDLVERVDMDGDR